MKSGFVVILGRPNAGKSTFLNAFLSKKVSIVTPKAQTTREAIVGIYHEKDLEISFIDTPGIFDGKEGLYKRMAKDISVSLSSADIALYIVDGSKKDLEGETRAIKSLKIPVPLIILLNKIDLMEVPDGMAAKEHYAKEFPNARLIEVSALKNHGFNDVKEAIRSYLPEGPQYYEDERITDKDKAFMAREVIRAKLLRFLNNEIPHTCAVLVDEFIQKKDSVSITATVYCEKERHVPIIVGKNGAMAKKVSMAARQELEHDFHAHVSLYLNVKCAPGWRDDARLLAKLGYGKDA